MVWIWGAKVSQSNVLNSPWLGSSQYVCNFIYEYLFARQHIFHVVHFSSTKIEPYLEVMLGLSSPCLPRWVRVSDGTKCVVLAWQRSPRADLLVEPSVWMGGLCYWFPVCVLPMVFEQSINNAICSVFSHDSNDSLFFPPQLMSSNRFDAAWSHPIIQNHVGIPRCKARLALRQVEGEEEPSAPQTSPTFPNHSCWSLAFCGWCLCCWSFTEFSKIISRYYH